MTALECAFALLKCSPIGNPENSSEYGRVAYILSEHCQGKEDVSEAAMRIFAERIECLVRERDEAGDEINIIRNTLSQNGEAVGNGEHDFSIIEMVENLMQSKDYFIRKSDSLERERDEAREDLEFRRGLYNVQEERLEKVIKELAEAREALDRK